MIDWLISKSRVATVESIRNKTFGKWVTKNERLALALWLKAEEVGPLKRRKLRKDAATGTGSLSLQSFVNLD